MNLSNTTIESLSHLARRCAVISSLTLLPAVFGEPGAESDAAAADARIDVIQLDKLEVQGERAESKNYKVNATTAGTRTNTALIDVPQSLAVVSEEQIKDQQMLSVGDVVRYVPGVTAIQGENNRDQLVLRGTSTSADFFINGVRDDVQYYRDLYNLTRVEVLRGPNALLFGRGGGGGLVNRVTKEAGFTPVHELTLLGGSFGDWRATIDVDEATSATFAGRVNALFETSGSFRRHVRLKRYAVNPTFTLAPGEHTKITLACENFHDFRTADRGITSFQGRPANVPVSTYYGDPDNSRVRAGVNLVSATIEHEAGNFTVRNHTLFGDYDRSYQNYVPGAANPAGTLVSLSAYNNATARRNLFNQTDVTLTAETGGIRHTLLGGAEFGEQLTDNFRNTGYFNGGATSILVPFDHPLLTTPASFHQSATDADNHLKTDLAAVYVQDQIEFNSHLLAVAGLRFDSFDLTYHNRRNGDTLGRDDDLVSPRAGVIFKPRANLSAYGSYTISYLPSSGDQFSSLTTITQQVKPEKFDNREIGVKWDADARLAFTAAVYRLDRTNTRATDPNDATRILQTGATRTSGAEFGINGSISSAWSVAGGYAYQDAVIRAATTAAPAGARVAQVPRHNFSFWNKYQFTRRWGIGAGVIYRSAMFAAVDNTVVVPGYARVDAAIYYSPGKNWRIQANVENVLDKKYYVNADNNTNISPGSPFALRFLARIAF